MFLPIGNLVKGLLRPLAPFLSNVLTGKLTGVGVVTGLAGAAVTAVTASNPHILTDQNIVAILHEVGLIITAIGTVIGSFGHGRAVGNGSAN